MVAVPAVGQRNNDGGWLQTFWNRDEPGAVKVVVTVSFKMIEAFAKKRSGVARRQPGVRRGAAADGRVAIDPGLPTVLAFAAAALVLPASTVGQAEPPGRDPGGEPLVLHSDAEWALPPISDPTAAYRMTSRVLAEERRVFLSLPPSHSRTTRQYPVVVVFDGESIFGPVAAAAKGLRLSVPAGARLGRRPVPFARAVPFKLMVGLLACAPSAAWPQPYEVCAKTVRFDSRGMTLVGTLHLPDKPGPHPAIVAGHGSGHVTRSDLYGSEIARHFAPRGVAVLQFDKRGTGESGGEHPRSWSSSMVIYAVDILAAVEALRARSDIDAGQVGLFGISQAGWVLPIAAAMSRGSVAFMIVVSGPTVSIAEENLYSDLTGSSAGRPTVLSHDEIRRRMAEAEPGGLAADAFIAELTIPALWIDGALDQSIPWEESIADIERAKAEWDRDFTVRVFENANHGLRAARTGGQWERPVPTEPADGYFETMERWLFDHARVRVP